MSGLFTFVVCGCCLSGVQYGNHPNAQRSLLPAEVKEASGTVTLEKTQRAYPILHKKNN